MQSIDNAESDSRENVRALRPRVPITSQAPPTSIQSNSNSFSRLFLFAAAMMGFSTAAVSILEFLMPSLPIAPYYYEEPLGISATFALLFLGLYFGNRTRRIEN